MSFDTVLVQITAYDPVANAPVTIYASSLSAPGDLAVTLNSQRWVPSIQEAPTYTIDLGTVQGSASADDTDTLPQLSMTYGALTLYLTPELGNTAWQGYDFDGATFDLYTGTYGSAFSGYTHRLNCLCGALAMSDPITATIQLRGNDTLLLGNMLSASYAGTGGAEGSSDLTGNLKPWLSGVALNLGPITVDSNYQVYQVHGYGAIKSIDAVYENALTLGAPVTNVCASYSDLVALALQPGQWATAPAVGMFRLGAVPTGTITADATGALDGGTAPTQLGAICSHVLRAQGGLPSSAINLASVSLLDSIWNHSYNVYVTGQTAVGDFVRNCLADAHAYLLPGTTGQWIFGRDTDGGAVTTLNGDQSTLPLVEPDYQQIANPASRVWDVRVGRDHNWTVLGADQVSDAVKEAQATADQANANSVAAQSAADAAAATANAATSALTNASTGKLYQVSDIVTDVDNLQTTYGSTSSAASSASDAASSASSAASYASTAQTASANATTANTNAQSASSAASTSATNAQTYQTGAQTARDTANTAASNASTANNNAQSALTAAQNAATTAGNAQTAAQAAQTAAQTAATTATTQAGTASSQATLAVGANASAQTAALYTNPSTFEQGSTYFGGDNGGAAPSNTTFLAVSQGTAAQNATTSVPAFIEWKAGVPHVAGNIYRVRAYVNVPAFASGQTSANIQLRLCLYPTQIAGTGRLQAYIYTTSITTANSWQWITTDITAPANTGAFAVPEILLNYPTSNTVCQCLALEMVDVTSQTAAAGSAGAAATSATNASASATTSSQQATIATNQATTATTQAGNAQTYANNASTSASGASGSANTATSQAGVATTQAGNASGSATTASNAATAASGSASTASTQATNAGNSATAAAASATSAATQAGNASTSASQAATSATNSAGSSNSAATSATTSAISAGQAAQTAASIMPSDFSQGSTFWADGYVGAPTARTGPTNTTLTSYPVVTGVGTVLQVSGVAAGSTYDFAEMGVMPVAATNGRRYRATVVYRMTNLGTGGTPSINLYLIGLSATYTNITNVESVHTPTAINTNYTVTIDQTSDALIAGGNSYMRVLPRVVEGASNTGAVFQFVTVKLEEVTDQYNAGTSAAAAATSATNAATSATAAGTSATSAQTAATTATTQAGNASTFANNASTSATSAQTASNTATAQSGVAATQASNALQSANTAIVTAAQSLPSDFNQQGTYWFNGFQGAPAAEAAVTVDTAHVAFSNVTGLGAVALVTPSAVNTNIDMGGVGVMPVAAGRTYRLTGTYQGKATSTGLNVSVYIIGLNATYAYVAAGTASTGANVTDTSTHSIAVTISGDTVIAAGCSSIRVLLRTAIASAGAVGGSVYWIGGLLEDITAQTAASASATAAANSASAASTSATAAGTSATSAQSSATTATTQAGNAQTYANNASTSASGASGSANTATTQAGVATTQANNASGSATGAANSASAASGSASSASTQATNAGNSASAAAASATAANTSAGNASTSASQAATSATNAAGSSNSAATSATTSASNVAAAQKAAQSTFPTTFEQGTTFFGGDSGVAATLNLVAATSSDSLAVLQTTNTGAYSYASWEQAMPFTSGNTYRITAKVKATSATFGTINLRIGAYDLATGGTRLTYGASTNLAVSSAWQTFTYTVTLTSATAAYVRPEIVLNYPVTSGVVQQIALLDLDDITAQTQAAASASAAATSATNAATSATAAGTSASSAQSSATTATTAAGNANTYANNASTSATTATTQANTATSQAGVSASSASNAVVSAAALFPSVMDATQPWTSFDNTSPANLVPLQFGASNYTIVSGVGSVWDSGATAAFKQICPLGLINPVVGRTYDAEVSARLVTANTVSGDTNCLATLQFVGLTSAYAESGEYVGAAVSPYVSAINNGAAYGWTTFKVRYTVGAADTAAYLRPRFYCNYNNNSGPQPNAQYQVAHFKVSDVTELVAAASSAAGAASSASAANTSAQSASTSATAAGQSATSASGSAGTASTQAQNALTQAQNSNTFASQSSGYASNSSASANSAAGSATAAQTAANTATTQAGNASNSATAANGSASSASSSAAAATSSANLAASIGFNSVNANPTFANWPTNGQPPASWVWWDATYGITRAAGVNGAPYCVEFPITGSSNSGIQQDMNAAFGSYVFGFTGRATNWNGSGMLIYFLDTNNAIVESAQINCATDADTSGYANADGGNGAYTRSWSAFHTTGINGAIRSVRIYVMGSWSGFSSTPAAKTVYFDKAWIRAATAMEIAGARADGNASAALSQIASESSTRAAADAAITTQTNTLTAQVATTPNLLVNPCGANGLTGWTNLGVNFNTSSGGAGEGYYFQYGTSSGNANWVGMSQDVPVGANQYYSLQGYVFAGGVSGTTATARIYMEFLDGNKGHLGYSNGGGVPSLPGGTGWTLMKDQAELTPSNTVYIRVHMDFGGPNAWSNNNVAYRRLKLENNPVCTVYSDDATTGQIASSVTVSQGAIASLQGKTSAYWQVVANAGTAGAVIAAKADSSGGSTITMAASQFYILNSDGSSGFLPVLGIENGVATFQGALRANSVTANSITIGGVTTDRIQQNGVSASVYVQLTTGGSLANYTTGAWQNFDTATGGGTAGGGGGSGGGGACPEPDAMILLANDDKTGPGDLIRAGDLRATMWVWTMVAGQYGAWEVSGASTSQQPRVMVTMEDGRARRYSPSHPFFLTQGVWRTVNDLQVGDEIDGWRPGVVAAVEPEGAGDIVQILISDGHTYMSDGLLSHNKTVSQQK